MYKNTAFDRLFDANKYVFSSTCFCVQWKNPHVTLCWVLRVTAGSLTPFFHKKNHLHIQAHNHKTSCSFRYSLPFISLRSLQHAAIRLWTRAALRGMHVLNRYGSLEQIFILWSKCCIQQGTNRCMAPPINLRTFPAKLWVTTRVCSLLVRVKWNVLFVTYCTKAECPKRIASAPKLSVFLYSQSMIRILDDLIENCRCVSVNLRN